MLTIHHLNDSRSQRIIWLAEELGLPYRIERHRRTAAGLAPDSLRRLHPLGKAPLVEHHGRQVAETGAIVAYMARGSALLPDEGSDAGDEVRYWMHYAEGSAMPPLLMRMVMTRLSQGAPWIVRPVARGLAAGLDRTWLGAEL
ncbi:MAG TPA: glutathione S-transferase, partial [Paracoccus sp. (in: a-proteobacteria)]|nr:glutathione S-transferase [Paracoccus sp. (in: a-proteobacteria)]